MTDFDDLRRHARLHPAPAVLDAVQSRGARKRRAAVAASGTSFALVAALLLALPSSGTRSDSLQPAEPLTTTPRPVPSAAPAEEAPVAPLPPAPPAPVAGAAGAVQASEPSAARTVRPPLSPQPAPPPERYTAAQTDQPGRYDEVVRTYLSGAAGDDCRIAARPKVVVAGESPNDCVSTTVTPYRQAGAGYDLGFRVCQPQTAGARTLTFSTGLEVDWSVVAGEDESWRWKPAAAGQAHQLVVQAGDCVEWHTRWHGVRDDGIRVEPGPAELASQLLDAPERALRAFEVLEHD